MEPINYVKLASKLRKQKNVLGIEIHRQWKQLITTSQKKLRYAILLGKIKHPTGYSCNDCGIAATVYDHRDYMKPYDVIPVCKRCNILRGSAIQAYIHWENWDAITAEISKIDAGFPKAKAKTKVKKSLKRLEKQSKKQLYFIEDNIPVFTKPIP